MQVTGEFYIRQENEHGEIVMVLAEGQFSSSFLLCLHQHDLLSVWHPVAVSLGCYQAQVKCTHAHLQHRCVSCDVAKQVQLFLYCKLWCGVRVVLICGAAVKPMFRVCIRVSSVQLPT